MMMMVVVVVGLLVDCLLGGTNGVIDTMSGQLPQLHNTAALEVDYVHCALRHLCCSLCTAKLITSLHF